MMQSSYRPTQPIDETYLQYLKAHRDVRVQHWNYYERLALLDGGTIALTVTAVLGNSHSQLKHKYTLCVGLALLVLAMISLLVRNLAESRREELMTTQQYCVLANRLDLAGGYQTRIEYFGRRTSHLERLGVYLTIGGIVVMSAVLVLSLI
jgi:hypothetical protein